MKLHGLITNYNLIWKLIKIYQEKHDGEYPKYIICTEMMLNKIIEDSNFDTMHRYDKKSYELFGIPIAICDKLEFDEMEIV